MKMRQWPVKILLVHPKAPFLKEGKITIAADCAVLVNKEIRDRFEDEAVVIGCPMLEDPNRVFEKIKLLLEEGEFEEVDVITMEVPCCQAIHMMVDRVDSDKVNKKINRYIVRVSGNIEEFTGKIDKSMIEAERAAHGGM